MSRGRLLIVRGLPGSGKSTYVHKNYPGLFTLETDMFNMVNGQYVWTRSRSIEAILLINKIVKTLMMSSNSPDFALTGVFCTFRSVIDHISNALEYDYDIYVKTLTTDYGNIHNVPSETIRLFKENFCSEPLFNSYISNYIEHAAPPRSKSKVFFGDMPPLNWKCNSETQEDTNQSIEQE